MVRIELFVGDNCVYYIILVVSFSNICVVLIVFQ